LKLVPGEECGLVLTGFAVIGHLWHVELRA